MKIYNDNAYLFSRLGSIPIVNKFLRMLAHRYNEGSIVCIKRGYAAGMLWKRYHRYVNGYWVGIYELEFQKRIAMELEEGDVFFDIGANAGFFSLIAAKSVGKTGRVVAFEPLPMNEHLIREQFDINNLDQCRCISSALGREHGIREFILPKSAKGAPSTSTAHLAGEEMKDEVVSERFNVPVTTLDDIVNREDLIPTLIKIDVEGAEGDVLYGGKKLLHSRQAPRILIETHGETVAKDVDRQLREAEYRFFTVHGKPLANGLVDRHYLAYPPLQKYPL